MAQGTVHVLAPEFAILVLCTFSSLLIPILLPAWGFTALCLQVMKVRGRCLMSSSCTAPRPAGMGNGSRVSLLLWKCLLSTECRAPLGLCSDMV